MGIVLALCATAIIGLSSARAHEFSYQGLDILHPWSRASAGSQKTGVIYLMIRNIGKQADTLIGASTPIAARAELHRSKMAEGLMVMEAVDRLEIAPGAEAVLEPHATHLMIIGLKQPLKAGDTFPLTLAFEQAGSVEVAVIVQGAFATEPDH